MSNQICTTCGVTRGEEFMIYREGNYYCSNDCSAMARQTDAFVEALGNITTGGGVTIEQVKADVDIADALSKKHSNTTDHAQGSDDQDLSGLVVKETGKSLVADTEIAKIHANTLDHAQGSDDQDLSGLVAKETGKSLVADTEIAKIHSNTTDHAPGSDDQDLSGLQPKETGKSLVPDTEIAKIHSNSLDHSHTNKSTLDAYTQTEVNLASAVSLKHSNSLDHSNTSDHSHTNKTTLDTYTQTEANLASAVSHAGSSHAPANAQKNSDITQPEIEAKLTGTIATHQHAGGVANAAGGIRQIQFNDDGTALGADADFTWDKTANELGLAGTNTSIVVKGITNEPAVPSAGHLRIYTKAIAGRMMPKWKAPSGVDTAFQPVLGFNTIWLWCPATGTTGIGTGFGNTWPACTGTITHPTVTNANAGTQMKVMQLANVATTANQILGLTASTATLANVWRGSSPGLGGFFFQCRFKIMLIPATSIRLFVGLTSMTTGAAAADTVTGDCCGFSHITTDAITNLYFMTRDNVTTNRTQITVPALAAGNAYDATIYCPPNGSEVFFRLVNLLTGDVLVDSSTSVNLPRTTIFMGSQAQMSNGANGTVATTAIGINKIYLETDM